MWEKVTVQYERSSRMYGFHSIKTLMALDLDSNQITSLAAKHLALAVKDNTVRLIINSVILPAAADSIKMLTKLVLNHNNIGIVGVIYMTKVSQENKVIFDPCSFDLYVHLFFNADTSNAL